MQTITEKTASALKLFDIRAADIAEQRQVFTDAIARARDLRAVSTERVEDLTAKRKSATAAWFLGITKRAPLDAIEAEAKKAQQDRERARLDVEVANMGEAVLADLVQPLDAAMGDLVHQRRAIVVEELRTLTNDAGHRLRDAIENLGNAYADVAAYGAVLQRIEGAQSLGSINAYNFDLPVPPMLEAFAGWNGRQQVVFHGQHRNSGREIFIDAAAVEREIAAQLKTQGIQA